MTKVASPRSRQAPMPDEWKPSTTCGLTPPADVVFLDAHRRLGGASRAQRVRRITGTTPAAAVDLLDPDRGVTYFLRMLVRFSAKL